jgi:hypothetical protein
VHDQYGSRAGRCNFLHLPPDVARFIAAVHRVMLNEKELRGRLTRGGSEVIAPHPMYLQQQIMKAFSSADVIVRTFGSAMLNVVFGCPEHGRSKSSLNHAGSSHTLTRSARAGSNTASWRPGRRTGTGACLVNISR